MCLEEIEKEDLSDIEDSVDVSEQRLEDYIEKRKTHRNQQTILTTRWSADRK